jgi:hypothetical protein
MTRHLLSVILSLSVFATTASAAFAQSAPRNPLGPIKRNSVNGIFGVDEEAMLDSRKLQITEDIEIMSRLLDATVKDSYYDYYFNSGVPVNTKWLRKLQIREPIRTFLNGYGVVYQLELPRLSEPLKPVAKSLSPSALSCRSPNGSEHGNISTEN